VYESRLELASLLLADFDPEVAVIAAQPFLVTAPSGGRVRRHRRVRSKFDIVSAWMQSAP